MLLGTLLLVVALLALVAALAASLLDLQRRGSATHRDIAVRGLTLGTGVAVFALLLLAGAFLVGDLSSSYVWRHVDVRYAWYQRLSGLWVGREGGLLLWTVMTLVLWVMEEWRHRIAVRRDPRRAVAAAVSANASTRNLDSASEEQLPAVEGVRLWARLTILVVGIGMLTTVLASNLFAVSDPLDVADQPFGRGVNPQLIIAFNAIHPPVVFLAYALTAIPTAFAVGHLVTGHHTWLGPARRWAHAAFLFLTVGVGLGGLWAYIALGWGGYWAWDPVEVGSVIPWLVVTTFLHAAYRADGRDEYTVAAPALAFLALPASLLSTFVVRAGGVWVSVHSFLAPGDAASAWDRYINALLTQPEVKLYTGLLALAAFGFLALLLIHVRRLEQALIAQQEAQAEPAADAATPSDLADDKLESDRPTNETTPYTDPPAKAVAQPTPTLMDRLLKATKLRNLFMAGVLLLALLTTVTVTILFLGVNGFPSDAVREAVYEQRTGPVALTAVLVMSLAIGLGALRQKQVLALMGSSLALGGIAALMFPRVWALAMAVPLLVATAVLAGTRIILAFKRMDRKGALRFGGIHAVHLGFAVLLLGHGFVSTFDTIEAPAELRIGETQQSGPYLLRLDRLITEDTDGNGRIDRIDAHVRIWQDGKDLGVVSTGYQYYDFQTHYKPRVGIERLVGKDIYLAPQAIRDPEQGWLFGNLPLTQQNAFEARDIDAFSLQVSTLPYINLVWTGAGLMATGAALLTYSSWTAHRPRPAPEARHAPLPGPA